MPPLGRDPQHQAAAPARRLQGPRGDVAADRPHLPRLPALSGRNIVDTPSSEMTAMCVGPVVVGGFPSAPRWVRSSSASGKDVPPPMYATTAAMTASTSRVNPSVPIA